MRKGALEDRLTLYYLDEVGFSLALPVTYTWSKRGSANRLRVPTRWGSQGRLNLLGAFSWRDRRLHFDLVQSSITSEHVIAFIDALTRNATSERVTVVVLDNAGFHISGKVRAMRPAWAVRGAFLRYLPPYCPHLNPIEALWKQLKAFLLPRRCYGSIAELRRAVLEALDLLKASRVNSS